MQIHTGRQPAITNGEAKQDELRERNRSEPKARPARDRIERGRPGALTRGPTKKHAKSQQETREDEMEGKQQQRKHVVRSDASHEWARP